MSYGIVQIMMIPGFILSASGQTSQDPGQNIEVMVNTGTNSSCSPNCKLPPRPLLSPCDTATQTCLYGCRDGYTGLTCMELKTAEAGTAWCVVLASIGCFVLVAAAIAIPVIVVHFRRKLAALLIVKEHLYEAVDGGSVENAHLYIDINQLDNGYEALMDAPSKPELVKKDSAVILPKNSQKLKPEKSSKVKFFKSKRKR